MGEVIPLRRTIPPAPPRRHFSDLAAILDIIKGQSYPAVVLLLTGVLLLVLRAKNGDNVKASLDDLNEFARGTRWEIRQWER